MKLLATSKTDQNVAVLDPWTVVHLGAGLAAGLLGFRLAPTMAAATVYEVAEQVAERTAIGRELFKTSGPESAANIAADMAVIGLGWWLGERYNRP